MSELTDLVATWWEAVDSFTHLLEKVPAEQWHAATDLPGWDVHDVAAHTAHLEHLLAGGRHEDIEIGDAPHARGTMGKFTEQGVVVRRGRTADDLIREIRESTTKRHTELLADPPTDPDAPAPGIFGAIGWSTRTLLRNRPLDVWMHEQDIRRAVGMPGGTDTAAARHTASYLLESMGYVLARGVKAPAGTSVTFAVEDHDPVTAVVGEDGRGAVVAEMPDATARIETDRESFLLLAGGRRRPADEHLALSGDTELANRVIGAMAVTP
jgi:uncharacterized protein (TIGR03083 family)